MNLIEFAVSVSVFLIFFIMVLIFFTNKLTNEIKLIKQNEYKKVVSNFFNHIIEKKGLPEDWNKKNETPIQFGLASNIYIVPLVVKEDQYPRINEIISLNLSFDENCKRNIINSSIRIFDQYLEEIEYSLKDLVFCPNNFLKSGFIVFYDNITANKEKKYYIYYSGENVTPVLYNKSSWLSAYWNFDEGIGNIANDLTENDNDGIITSGSWVFGKYGKALNFENGLVNVSYSQSFNSSEITIEAWIKINEFGFDREIIQKNNAYGIKLGRSGEFNNRLIGYVEDLPQNYQPISNEIDTNTWYHVVFTSDGNENKLYINGILENSTIFYNPIPKNDGNIGIGGSSLGTNYVNATIDEVRIYNKVLSIDEIIVSNNSSPVKIFKFSESETSVLSFDKLKALKSFELNEIQKTIGMDYKFRIEVYKP